jgi:hypothetical protein
VQRGLVRVQRGLVRVQRSLVRVQRSLVRVRRGLVRAQRGLVTVQRGLVRVQRGLLVARWLAVRQARVRISARHPMKVPPTEPTAMKIWRWASANVYELCMIV